MNKTQHVCQSDDSVLNSQAGLESHSPVPAVITITMTTLCSNTLTSDRYECSCYFAPKQHCFLVSLNRQSLPAGQQHCAIYWFCAGATCHSAPHSFYHYYITFGSLLSQIHRSSITFMSPTPGGWNFWHISLPFSTLAILWASCKIFTEIVPG